MLSDILSALVVPALLFSSLAQATQVDKRSVGAFTPLSAKSTVCNVLDYGAAADNLTDVGPAILSAFTHCAKAGGATIYIPPGTYSLATGVVLNKGSSYAIQIDGLIVLTSNGSFGGNAFVIKNTSDVEVFSSNGLGAIDGQGYIERITHSGQNARLFRFISATDISFHDIILVDSPTFHLVFNGVSNMETYHVTIRGPNLGGTDGIDLICTDNCYIHDCEVTNRDECVSVKSPSQNVLIEDMYCNQSGGMSIGSLTADITDEADAAAVTNITMRNIYIFQCTQMLMIKTFPGGNGPTGYVTNSVFENFWAYDTTYALDIDQYWESRSRTSPDTGAVALSGLTFNNWTGTVDNGIERGPIVIRGSDIVPLTDITLTNFDMWTVKEGEIVNQCKNVYGTGYCAGTSTDAALTSFTTSVTIKTPPAGFISPTSPAWGIAGYGTSLPIPIYTPAVFWSPVSSGVVSSLRRVASMTNASSVTISTSKAASVSTIKFVVASSTSAPVVSSSAKSSTKGASTSLYTSSSSSVIVASSALGVAVSSISSRIVKINSTLEAKGSSSSLFSSSISVPATTSSAIEVSTPTKPIESSSSARATISTGASRSSSASTPRWGQCGGIGWDLPETCVSGTTCQVQNEWYSQCL